MYDIVLTHEVTRACCDITSIIHQEDVVTGSIRVWADKLQHLF